MFKFILFSNYDCKIFLAFHPGLQPHIVFIAYVKFTIEMYENSIQTYSKTNIILHDFETHIPSHTPRMRLSPEILRYRIEQTRKNQKRGIDALARATRDVT